MKTIQVIGLFFEAAWLGFASFFTHLNSPLWHVCAQCKKPLGGNPQSKDVSHGLCARCFFRTLRPTLVIAMAVLSLGLSACEHKARMTGGVKDEKAYCAEHPTECVVYAQTEVRP